MLKTVRKIAIWIITSLVAACILLNAGLFVFSGAIVGPAPAPLQLPPLSPAASTAFPVGSWIAGDGSVAGFRVQESFLTQSGTIVGRTSAVTGSLVIAHNEISSGSFHIDLSKVSVNGKQNASFFKLLETDQYPDATITLTQPKVFASLPPDGQAISSKASGSLTMHGLTHTLTFTIKARYNGTVLEAVGTAPSLASDWNVTSPFGVHNDGVIEFLVVLRRG